MVPRAASFSSAARATPVWGQAKAPSRSARAAALASSDSVASSTTPSNAFSTRIARWMETGSPIWMAEASVRSAFTGVRSWKPRWKARNSGLALAAWATAIAAGG